MSGSKGDWSAFLQEAIKIAHKIRVDYYNGSGGFWLNVLYKGPGIVKQIIGADKLFVP